MAHRIWGLLCPEGHGLLTQREEWTAQGVAWCPHEDHGGNGRFWRLNEAEEGWHDPNRISAPSEAQLARIARAEERAAEWTAYHDEQEKQRMAKAKAEKAEKVPAKGKTPQECLCGCKGMTKGGRFLPGHDARYHAAQKRAAAGPEPIKTKPAAKPKTAAKPKAPDLTARAEDETPTETPIEV